MAISPGSVGLVTLLVSFLPVLSGTGSVPRGLILLIGLQAIAFAILRVNQHPHMRSLVATILSSAVLTPLLALQVTLLREPYVSYARQSAAPSIVATLIVAMVLIACAVWTLSTSWEEPDEAGLLFMPLAMMVPAMVGMRSSIQQRPALEMLGYVLLLAAVATCVGWLLPISGRLLVPAGAVAVEFIGLWLTGHGPWFHHTSGDIVRLLYVVLLALAVILVVMVPYGAAWIRHGTRRSQAAGPDHRVASGRPRASSTRR